MLDPVSAHLLSKIQGYITSKVTKSAEDLFKKDYPKEILRLFNETIDEYEKKYSKNEDAFYNYEKIADSFLKFSFYRDINQDEIKTAIENTPNAVKPTDVQLNYFKDTFKNKIETHSELNDLELNTNFNKRIDLKLDVVIEKVDNVAKTVNNIDAKLDSLKRPVTRLPKYLTSIPAGLAENAIGRAADLEKVEKLLNKEGALLLVNGMGGIGKSTLAQMYLEKHKNDFDHIAFLEVQTIFDGQENDEQDALFSAFTGGQDVSLIKNLNIVFEERTLPELKFLLVLNALRNVEGNNLLIVDNTGKIIEKYRGQLPSWKTLITSRCKMETVKNFDLDVLPHEEAEELFYKYYLVEKDDHNLKKILEYTGYHTLTIELLARSWQKKRAGIKELADRIKNEGLALANTPKTKTLHKGKSGKKEKPFEHLLNTFIITMDDAGQNILRWLSILPSYSYTLEELKLYFNIEMHEEDFFEELESLSELGWIIKNETKSTYRCHQIIQEIVRKKLLPTRENCASIIKVFTKLLSVDESKDNPIEKFKWIEFGKKIEKYFHENDNEIAALRNNLGLRIKDSGDFQTAKMFLEKVLFTFEKNFGENHTDTAISQSNLATILQDLGKFEEAKKLLKKVLNYDEKYLGEEHPSTATSRSNLAIVLQDLGEYEEAKKLLKKTILSDEKFFGENHPSTAISYSNLALVLRDLGEYEEAKKLLNKALSSDKKNFGEDHPSVTRDQSNLALVLLNLGEFNEAKALLRQALISDEKNYGEDHPSTAKDRSSLAVVLRNLGEFAEAKKLLRQAISSDEKNYGEDHPSTARDRSNLALVLQNLGEFAEAKELLRKALSSDEKNFGEDHPDTTIKRSNLGVLLRNLGEFAEAKELLRKALSSDEKNFGKNHPSTARSCSNLAIVLKDLGEDREALFYIEKAYHVFNNKLGPNHPSTITVAENMEVIKTAIKKKKQ